MSAPLLEVRGLTKRFGGLTANVNRWRGQIGLAAAYVAGSVALSLLALVADQIIERAAPVEASDDLQVRTLAEALALRDALLAYRDGAEVVSSTLALGLGADEALARIRVGIDAVCPDAEVARVAAESILFLILGQVWHQQQRMQADSLGVVAPAVDTKPADAAAGVGLDGRGSLEFGIGLILDGLQKKLTLTHGSR